MDRREDTIQGWPDEARVANIASRLSQLERRAMLHREGGSEACMSWETAQSLYERGLTQRCARFLRLTSLGKKVRASLQAPPNTSIGERDDD
jgi:hypothetical protein